MHRTPTPRQSTAYNAGRTSETPLSPEQIREWGNDAKAAFVAGRSETKYLRNPSATRELLGADEANDAHLTGTDMAPWSNDGGAAWAREIANVRCPGDDWEMELAPEQPY